MCLGVGSIYICLKIKNNIIYPKVITHMSNSLFANALMCNNSVYIFADCNYDMILLKLSLTVSHNGPIQCIPKGKHECARYIIN